MTGLLGLGPDVARAQLALALAPIVLWIAPWAAWVLYLHGQPGGVTIEWLVVGAFGVAPCLARLAALKAQARAPGPALLVAELLAVAALSVGRIELALACGVAVGVGCCARGWSGETGGVLHRLGQLAVLVACGALVMGYASNRPSMSPRFVLALPLIYEALRGPRGGDAAIRRIAGAAGVSAFALCRYEPLWGVVLGGWAAACALFALGGGGRRRQLRALAVLAVCLLGLGLLDIAVRLRGTAPPPPPSLTGDELQANAGGVPMWKGVGPDGEQVENPIHWNDPPLGLPMHDVRHELEKPVGVKRVLVLGDSFVEGVHVPVEALFHRQLGAALTREGRQVEALAQARSGWGQVEELTQLREVGLRYAPDLVLVEFLPQNDVRDNTPEIDRAVHAEDVRSSWAKPLELDARYKGLVGVAQLAHGVDLLWRKLVRGNTDRLGNQVYLEQPVRMPEAWAQGWARTEATFLELQAAAREAGAELGVVIFPGRAELDREGLDYPARRVAEFCAVNGVPLLDLTPVFKADPDYARAYLKEDGHWSVHGHARAARATASWVEEAGLLR